MAKLFNRLTVLYTDAEYVEGLQERKHDKEESLYYHCKKYYEENYKSVVFVDLKEELKREVFQESFIALWENILSKKLYVEDGVLKGKDGKPFSGKLTTYFMSIVRYKYYEITNHGKQDGSISLEDAGVQGLIKELFLTDDEDESETKLAIISDCLSHMQEHCRQILSLFYYELKSLEKIVQELHYVNTDSLKNAKCRCVKNLRECSNAIYERYYK